MDLLDSRYSLPDSSGGGFTLLEILIFVAIFSGLVITFMTVFVATSQIQVKQAASAEVASQSQFVLQTIQYYVSRASLIEIEPNQETSYVNLRMASSSQDQIQFFVEEDRVAMQTNGSTVYLTNSKVIARDMVFTRRQNVPGHDSLSVAFSMEYNTSNIKQNFAHALRTSITRVSAATFDSNVVPSSDNTFNLGVSTSSWRSINGTLYFSGSNVGVGVSSPASTFQVAGGDIYVSTAGEGVILKAPNGTTCVLVTASNAGSTSIATTTCP